MISEALHSLDIDDYVFLGGQPTNETEFLVSFRKVVGKDATDTAILSSDPATFGVTWAQVAPKIAELQAAYDAQAYSRSREAEYPNLQDCIHAILDNELEALQVKRQAVKTKYPKP